jgi:hypothetical protein
MEIDLDSRLSLDNEPLILHLGTSVTTLLLSKECSGRIEAATVAYPALLDPGVAFNAIFPSASGGPYGTLIQ